LETNDGNLLSLHYCMYWNFSSMEAWNGRNQMFFLFANYTEIIFIRLTPEYKLVRINKAKNLRNAIPKGESGLLSFSFTLYIFFYHLLSLFLLLFPSIWFSFYLPVFFFLFLWSLFLFLLLFLRRIIYSFCFSFAFFSLKRTWKQI
jgi:hypothetical protein